MWARRAAAFILGALALVQSAWGCSSQGSASASCSSDSDCGTGRVCGTTTCQGLTHCIPAGCACTQGPGYIFAPGDACLTAGPPACNCDHATCTQPRDSCGKDLCPGVCGLGESCAFCLDGDACALVEPCLGSLCITNYSRTKAACRPEECLGTLMPPLCGSPDALCGEECCPPDCSGRVCGEDPLCGVSCGVCEGESFCNLYGQCQLDAAYPLCPGDLRATPPEVGIEDIAGPLPAPLGGVIADGIYDLTSIRRTVQDAFAQIYLRAAVRFSNGGTAVEQAYDADLAYFADSETPHRLMNVVRDGTVLHFTVTCPDIVLSIDQQFDRGFTVQGSELWLIQDGLMEIYSLRP